MTFTKFSMASLICCVAGWVHAQQPPATPKDTPQAEAGEPRANTSGRTDAQTEAGEPRANTTPPAAPAPGPKPAPPPPKGIAKPGSKAPNAADHVELSTATVTGDREQPKVMYIVPWKRSDIGDLEGKPMNSLVDEVLSPVDRDVFRREVRYYNTVNSDAPAPRGTVPPDKGEK